jgi:zinc protease
MRPRVHAIVLAIAFLLSSERAHGQAVDPFALPSERIVLPNGLTVLLAPDPHARLATVAVSYGVGQADEPDGLRGLAHMAEHLVASRTRHASDVFRELEAAGGVRFNAVTSLDRTVYFESVPPEHLATALWLESDRMGYAADAVTEPRVAAERAVLANEDRDRRRDGSLALVEPFTMQELFPAWHPYASEVDELTDFGRIEARDVVAFLRTWYLPSNATLAIAGAFDRAPAMAAIERFFGGLTSAPVPARPALPAWTSPGAWQLVHATSAYDEVRFAWPTPAFGSKDDAALDLAATILSGAGNERLGRSLVAAHLAKSVAVRQQSMRLGSIFAVSITLEPGVDVDRVIKITQAAVDDLARGPTTEEVARARDHWRGRARETLESTWGRIALLIDGELTGDHPGPGFDWCVQRHAALEPADIGQAVARQLVPARRVVTAIYATPGAPLRGILVRREEVSP